jgi:hypothetical protein
VSGIEDLTIRQGTQWRSPDETFPYIVDISSWTTSTPSAATGALYDITLDTNVSTSKLSGTASISTTNITTESFTGLVSNHEYRYELLFTVNAQKYEAYIPIRII